MPLPAGEIQGSLGELALPENNTVVRRLGGLGTGFCLNYAEGVDFTEYRLTFDTEPLTPDATVGLINDPLQTGTWGTEKTWNAFKQLINTRSILYRRTAAYYPGAVKAPLSSHINTIMDVLDSTDELAWRQATIQAYDESSVIDRTHELLPTLSLRQFNKLWTLADLPTLGHKRLRRLPPLEQVNQRAEKLKRLSDDQQASLFQVAQQELFHAFHSTSMDAQPDGTIDRSGTIYIEKSLVPDDCEPEDVFEFIVGPAVAQPTTLRNEGSSHRTYPIHFRTTETLYTARPALSWLRTSDGTRTFLLPPPEIEKDPLGESAVATEYVLGLYVTAALCESRPLTDHVSRFKFPYQAVAALPYMALAEANTLLATNQLTTQLEARTR